jgi:hypothetical protein
VIVPNLPPYYPELLVTGSRNGHRHCEEAVRSKTLKVCTFLTETFNSLFSVFLQSTFLYFYPSPHDPPEKGPTRPFSGALLPLLFSFCTDAACDLQATKVNKANKRISSFCKNVVNFCVDWNDGNLDLELPDQPGVTVVWVYEMRSGRNEAIFCRQI